MTYAMKPLGCDPARVKGMSERLIVNQWASDHCHTLAGATPILALDMYEHSYHIDFGAKADSYVETFMQTIRWGNAERLFKQLEG